MREDEERLEVKGRSGRDKLVKKIGKKDTRIDSYDL